ncbi:hypothetical protein Tco_0090355 [Tanacetum coccineum]
MTHRVPKLLNVDRRNRRGGRKSSEEISVSQKGHKTHLRKIGFSSRFVEPQAHWYLPMDTILAGGKYSSKKIGAGGGKCQGLVAEHYQLGHSFQP